MRFLAPVALGLLALYALSPVSATAGEREMMMATCGKVGSEASLCRRVVNDVRVNMNYKRSCLRAITLLLEGGAWSRVKSLPETYTCREGLAQAGYPVAEVISRLTGQRAQR